MDAEWLAREVDYAAVVLDVMLPGRDGFAVCRRLREAGRWLPVVMLTARDEVADRVRGLDCGADDYVVKPFSFAELAARIRAATGDPSRLRQAIGNLLDNALTHTPAGGRVVLSAGREPGRIRTSVVDDGPGFPSDFLPTAFVPFQRADPSRRRDGGGTGLGLAIVRMIAVAHGGDATAANRPGGRGAIVSITIPD